MIVERTDVIMKALDQRADDIVEEKVLKPRNYFRGSEVGHCSNQINFRRRGTEIPEMALVKSRFLDDGHLHQAVLSKEMKEAGIDVFGEEEEIKKKIGNFTIIAHKDGSVKTAKGKATLLEVKSVKEERFQEILKTGDVSSYYAQIQMYMYLWNYSKCRLIVVDRNNSARQEFIIGFDEEFLNGLVEKLTQIENDIKKGVPSSRDYPRTSKECGWCPYYEECWGVKKSYRDRKDEGKAVEVDGKNELRTWGVIHDLYLKSKRLEKEAEGYRQEADGLVEILFKKFKATKLHGPFGFISRSVSERQNADRATINELILKGVIPVTTNSVVSIRYTFKKEEEE